MKRVFMVEGWFGREEWLESIWLTDEEAQAEVNRLWETRSSPLGPEYSKRLHKFAAEQYPVGVPHLGRVE